MRTIAGLDCSWLRSLIALGVLTSPFLGPEQTGAQEFFLSDSSPVGNLEATSVVSWSAGTPVSIEGYSISLATPPELEITSIAVHSIVEASVAVEFESSSLEAGGATLVVLFDNDPPFDGQTLLGIATTPLAEIQLRCTSPPLGGGPAESHSIDFVDGVFGTPPVFNAVRIGGTASPIPTTTSGTITCLPATTRLFAGREVAGAIDPEISVRPNELGFVHFFYDEPNFSLGGFQLAVGFGDEVTLFGEFLISETIVDTVGAEFVTTDADNNLLDGDGIELVVGILLDALPPFDGQTVPPTVEPLAIGRIAIQGESLGCSPVEFVDGLNGTSSPVFSFENVSLVGTEALGGLETFGAEICVEVPFLRGDCNGDGLFNLGDAIFLLSYTFSGGTAPSCVEACNVNSDLLLDIADAVAAVTYLFAGGPAPSAPFPSCDGVGPAVDCQTSAPCP